MMQQRNSRSRRAGAQSTGNRNGQIRRRRPRVSRNPQNTKASSKPKAGQLESVMSWIKKADVSNLSGHLHSIADYMATFGQVTDMMKQFSGPSGGLNSNGGSSFNLMNLVKGNNIGSIIQAVLPVLGGLGMADEGDSEPIKVDPISVKDHQNKSS